MNQKTANKILRYVAEHSPKSFAKRIKKRNEKLLVNLKKNIPVIVIVPIGCPHCTCECSECLWTEAAYDEVFKRPLGLQDSICCEIPFNGITYANQKYVIYSRDHAEIFCDCYDEGKNIKNLPYQDSIKFLEGHIAWAKQKYWGRKI